MSTLVDIHAHVLPGIDDGPDSLSDSLAMARAAVAAGVATIASTPHLREDFPDVRVDELADRCQALRDAFDQGEIPVKLVSGAEVSLTWALNATAEELRLASYSQKGTDLLIEAPTVNTLGIDRLLYELRAEGYRITLGHPERSMDIQQDESQIRSLVDQGVLFQINADSLLGPRADRGPKRLARDLVTNGLAHVIASDAHRGTRWRPVTRLPSAVAVAIELVGTERAAWMSEGVPRAILEGEELPGAPPIIGRQRPRRWIFGLGRG